MQAVSINPNILGLKSCGETVNGTILEAGNGTQIILYKREKTKADHTVLGFDVEDLEKEVKLLKEKGVVFEEYDNLEIKTVNSIATMGNDRAAWFKDTEGNILALGEWKE